MCRIEKPVKRATHRIQIQFLILLTLAISSLYAKLDKIVPYGEQYPGTWHDLPSGCTGWVPEGVVTVKGILVGEMKNHNGTVLAALHDFAIVDYDDPAPATKAAWDAIFNSLAEKSGKAEIKSAPFLISCGSRFSGLSVDLCEAYGKSRCLAYRSGQPGNPSPGGTEIPRVVDAENSNKFTLAGADLWNKIKSLRGSDSPVTAIPQWGWPHGSYSNRDYILPFFDWAMNERAGGKSFDQTSAWSGDPSSWNGEWPEIKQGNDKNWVWLPNKDLAYVWKAYVTRHPTLNNKNNPWGVSHVGGAGTTYELASPPQVFVNTPVRPYNIKSDLASYYPVFPQDTNLVFTVSGAGYADIDSIEFFDASSSFSLQAGNTDRIWVAAYQFKSSGVKSIHVRLKLKNGTRIQSRPATCFVADLKAKSAGPATPSTQFISAVMGADFDAIRAPSWDWAKGGTPSSTVTPISESSIELRGNGDGFYWCWDRAAIAYMPSPTLTGDFILEARIKNVSEMAKGAQIGIAVKEDRDLRAPVISLRWDNIINSLTWFNRTTLKTVISVQGAGGDHLGDKHPSWGGEIPGSRYDSICLGQGYWNKFGSETSPDGVSLKIERSGKSFTIYYKKSGGWEAITPNSIGNKPRVLSLPEVRQATPEGKIFVDTIGRAWPMLYVAGGDPGESFTTAIFDNIKLTASPVSLNNSEKQLDPNLFLRYRVQSASQSWNISIPATLASLSTHIEVLDSKGRILSIGKIETGLITLKDFHPRGLAWIRLKSPSQTWSHVLHPGGLSLM